MKFSVIIPLYNKAPYVKKALESVFAQTYTDFELIIVDDGSSDNSLAAAKQCITDRCAVDRCTVDRHDGCRSALPVEIIEQANSGVSAARNNGFSVSSGEYIAFLDADDWWEPTFLEKMAKLIEDYPEAGLYASNYIYYKPGKTRVAINNIATGYFNYPKAYYEGGAMPITSISVAIPRNVYDEMGGFPLGIKLGEDFLLWAKIAMYYPVTFLNEPLAYYNNDVPATLRATRNLHKPEYHMLFNLEAYLQLLPEGKRDGASPNRPIALSPYRPTDDDWRRLIDKLRISGLLDYWLDKRFHNQAQEELKKVDWNKQPASVVKIYKTPIWILKTKKRVMRLGSFFKLTIIKLLK